MFDSPIWRSLRHRNYRLYLSGQLVSLCGTWMQQIAQSWLVFRLTGSATILGVVSFASQIPIFGLAPLAGVITDRFSRYRLTLLTQRISLILALLLAGFTLFGQIRVWHIILLGLAQGVVLAFDMPARQSLVNELVGGGDLPNAIALNSSMVNAARIVGPAIAGVVVATVGEGVCFLINALSYLAVIWGLLLMKLPITQKNGQGTVSLFGSIREGATYISGTLPIRDLLLLLGLMGLMGMPYITLMPVFAGEVIQGGAHALGLLMGAVGIGALAGALALARRGNIRGLGKIAVHGHFVGCWILVDGINRRGQYDIAIAGGRSNARPCHEHFLNDVGGHGPVRKPAFRRTCRSHRCTCDSDHEWMLLHVRWAVVRIQAAALT